MRGEGVIILKNKKRKRERRERIFCYARRRKTSGSYTSVFRINGPFEWFEKLRFQLQKALPTFAKLGIINERKLRAWKRTTRNIKKERRKVAMQNSSLCAKTRSTDR